MKILVIERTSDQNWRQVNQKDIYACTESKMMDTFIQEYKEKNQISEEIEFIFLKGSNCGGSMSQWRCYHEDSVLEVIQNLISEGEIDGLLLDPVLTEDEEIGYKYCNNMTCELASKIYHAFKDDVPVAFSVPVTDTSRFEGTQLHTEVMLNARNQSTVTPIFHLAGMKAFYERMFRYYMDCINQTKKENSKEPISIKYPNSL